MRAPRPRSPISVKSTPTVSIPADYPVPNFSSLTDPAALADAEMRLTASVVTYAHHAQVGRVHWTRVSGDISTI